MRIPVVVAMCVGAWAGCGREPAHNGARPLDRYLGIPFSSEETFSEDARWTLQHYDPASGAVCLGGKPYQTAFRPGPGPDVVLFLQGGGACWNDLTCTLGTAAEKADVLNLDGLLALPDPNQPDEDDAFRNYFSQWSVLYAGYCDGSLFGGDNDPDYPVFGQAHHHGLQNLSAAITTLRTKVPNPRRVLVAGVSAGGYGTLLAITPVLMAFPSSDIYVLDDSGPGLVNDNPAQRDEALRNWNLDENVPPGCDACDPDLTPLFATLLERHPRLKRVGLFSSYGDRTISGFLAVTPWRFRTLLVEETDAVRGLQPDRFKRYFVDGNEHTIINRPRLWRKHVRGRVLSEWIMDLVEESPRWDDVLE